MDNSSTTLNLSPQMMAVIQEIAHESNLSLDEMFTRAIALYKVSLQANAEGKHVGYTSSTDGLEVEFAGLTANGSH